MSMLCGAPCAAVSGGQLPNTALQRASTVPPDTVQDGSRAHDTGAPVMSERETVLPTSSRPSGGLSNQLAASAEARRCRACGCVRFRRVLSSEMDGLWHLIGEPPP